jgi:hypothetical protein
MLPKWLLSPLHLVSCAFHPDIGMSEKPSDLPVHVPIGVWMRYSRTSQRTVATHPAKRIPVPDLGVLVDAALYLAKTYSLAI